MKHRAKKIKPAQSRFEERKRRWIKQKENWKKWENEKNWKNKTKYAGKTNSDGMEILSLEKTDHKETGKR